MTKNKYIPISLVCMINLSAAVPSMANDNRVEGARSCISMRALTSTEVLDDQVVVFHMRGKTAFLNVLAKQCKGLYRYGRFTSTTQSGSLCKFDRIRVLIDGAFPGRTCRLGDFYLIDEKDIPGIIELRRRPVASDPLAPADVEEILSEPEDPESPKKD